MEFIENASNTYIFMRICISLLQEFLLRNYASYRTENITIVFYYCNIVLYYRKSNIFDNIKNIIAILDGLVQTLQHDAKINQRQF